MSISWDNYVYIAVSVFSAGGMGWAYGQWRLAIKQYFEAAGV